MVCMFKHFAVFIFVLSFNVYKLLKFNEWRMLFVSVFSVRKLYKEKCNLLINDYVVRCCDACINVKCFCLSF